MRKALSLVLIAVFLVSLFGGLSVVPSAKAVAQEVTYNLGTEPATLDPGITATLADLNIDLQVFDGLTRIDSKNVGVRALDAKTLKVYLQSPTAYFLSLTAFPTYMPVCKAVVSKNDKWAADLTNYVTNGPFKLAKWSHNEKMVFVKNPSYWDKDNDIATAKALLAHAGYPNGKGFPAFALLFNTSNLTKTICEAIQGMWKKNLGITTCTLRNEELGVFVDDLIHMNFNLALVQWTGDYMDPSTFLYMFVTGGGSSHTGWSNKSYDALIAKAKATTDPEARMATLHAAEKILMTDFPILPIYYCTSPVLLSKSIKNFYQSALGIVDWKNAYMG